MDNLLLALKPSMMFIQENILVMMAILGSLIFSFIMFIISIRSLNKLKVEAYPYYPFDRFFPQAGKWSIGYFFIVILFLSVLIYLLIKGQFILSPA